MGNGTPGIALIQQTWTHGAPMVQDSISPVTLVGHSSHPYRQAPTLQAHQDLVVSQDKVAEQEPWDQAGHWGPQGAQSWGQWRWAESSWCCCWLLGGGHGQDLGH
jgi:hypothetical protein